MSKFVLTKFFLIVFLCFSCKKEEGLNYQKNYIDNKGYFPVAPKNAWLYETWQANLSEDGSYNYEGIPTLTSNSIIDINYYNESEQVDYLFNPYPNVLLAGLLGNFNKIKKVNNKYYRDATLDLTSNSTDFNLDIKGSLFLDENAKVGDLLNTQSDTFKSNLFAPVDIKYSVKTYVTGKYNKLPTYLTNKPGVDDQLAQYTDIIKVTDSLVIDELILGINSLNVDVDIVSQNSGRGSQNIGPSPTTKISGEINLRPNLSFLGPIPLPLFFDIPITLGGSADIASIQLNIIAKDIPFCPTTLNLKENKTINLDFKIISNDVPVVIDNYFAKGVGKIKTITNIEQIKGTIKVDEFKDRPYKLIVVGKPENELCKDDPSGYFGDPNKKSSFTLELKLRAVLDGLFVSIPFSVGIKTDFVQNLKAYSLRKTLN